MLSNFCLSGKTKSGVCPHCDAVRDCTWEYRRLEQGGITAEHVLCAICQECQEVAWLAAQAGQRFWEARENIKAKRTTISVPLEIEDYVSYCLALAGASPTHHELFFRALLLCCVDNEDGVAEMLRTVDHEALHLQSRTRMSLLLNERMQNLFAQLQAASGIGSASELLRRLIVLSSTTLKPALDSELRRLAYAYA